MIKSITILMIFVTMKKGDNSPSLLTYNKSLNLQKLQNSITQNKNFISVKGLYGSSKSFIISELFKNNNCILEISSKIRFLKEEVGSSISCSGACLTVEKFKGKLVKFYISK